MTQSARLNPAKIDRAMAARGLDGETLAKLAALDESTVSRARRGKAVKPRTIEKLIAALQKAPVIDGAEELLA